MSQTMLATLTLVIVTLYSAQQHREIVHQQLGMIQNEIASMATGVAVDRLEEIGAVAFDEHTREVAITSPSQLTPYPFLSDTQADDIDDFHNVVLDTFRVAGTDTLRFMVESKVQYVKEDNLEHTSSSQTKFKRATVKVYSTTVSTPDTVRISQTYSCGSRCAW